MWPDEGQGNDVVRVDADKPVAIFAVWVRVRIVGREDEAWRSGHIPTTRSLEERTEKETNRIMHKNTEND